MENKKIAVIFAGQPRTFRHTFESHLEFFKLDGYEFDYFIHGWSDQWYRKDKTGTTATLDNEIKEDPDSLKNELKEIYNPKGIAIENQKECLELQEDIKSLAHLAKRAITKGRRAEHFTCGKTKNWLDETHAGQVYSWQKATELKISYQDKTKTQYDGVIKFRLDNLFHPHNDERKQDILNNICNHELGGAGSWQAQSERKERMKFQWQNKPPRDHWNVGDMMFGGPNGVFDLLMKDVYIFWLRYYCRAVGKPSGKWIHLGSSEGVLGRKLIFNEIPTGSFVARHFPYRDYMIDSPDQAPSVLHKLGAAKLKEMHEMRHLKQYKAL